MEEVKVTVVQFGDRKYLQMQYRDPFNGRKKTRSTGTTIRRDAERIAAKWEAELQEGRYKSPSKVLWAEFRQMYEDEVLASLASNTDRKATGVFNSVEKILNPTRLRDLTAHRLSFYQRRLREKGGRESTISSHLAHLVAALNWAVEMGMLAEAPVIKRPKRAKKANRATKMKGRPITLEEFERMLDKVELTLSKPVRPETPKKTEALKRRPSKAEIEARLKKRAEMASVATPSWQHYLTGLWLSGLRLEESLELSWDDPGKLCIDLLGPHPMLVIPAELEKGHQDRLLPMAPEFANFLLLTPESERTGYVFNPASRRPGAQRLNHHRVGEIVSAIGKSANVKVHADPITKQVKFASAHDLRRSFGERWAARIMPTDLMVLMRHESIETTMRFYVGRNAAKTAAMLWESYEKTDRSNTSGNTATKSPPTDKNVPT